MEHGVHDARSCDSVRSCSPGDRPTRFVEVTTFLRDVGIRGIFSDDLVDDGPHATMPKLGRCPSLRRLLRAPTLQARTAAIYTLGKLSFRARRPRLFEQGVPLLPEPGSFLPCAPAWRAGLARRSARGPGATRASCCSQQLPGSRWSALGYLSSASTHRPKASVACCAPSRRTRSRSSPPKLNACSRKRSWKMPVERPGGARRSSGGTGAGALPKAAPRRSRSSMIETLVHETRWATTGKGDYALDELAQFVHRLRGAARD